MLKFSGRSPAAVADPGLASRAAQAACLKRVRQDAGTFLAPPWALALLLLFCEFAESTRGPVEGGIMLHWLRCLLTGHHA